LFRNEEAEMRKKLVEADLVECVLGLGPNLFYNSPMEACIVICRTRKPNARQRRILFIDAVHDVARERAQSFLKPEHQQRILGAYRAFADEPGFAKVASVDVLANGGSLGIPRYVRPLQPEAAARGHADLATAWAAFDATGREFWLQVDELIDTLDAVVEKEAVDVG
jgi:type I restriction enzyme M protein